MRFVLVLAATFGVCASAPAAERPLTSRLHHLRAVPEREWSDFPKEPETPSLELRFRAESNLKERALRLRQQDVRQTWKVRLNGKELGRLLTDENDTVIYVPVPPRMLLDGDNLLSIEQVGRVADDIRVGMIALDDRPVSEVLSEASVEIGVVEVGPDDARAPVPCRLTVLDAQGALMTLGAASSKERAVRPGVVYTSTGRARFGLPAGAYTIYAGRGFEYSVDSVAVTLRPGERVQKNLALRREVATPGLVGCDTHIHTLTFSGHGDCSLDERMITLAGEGLELPIATDHNKHVDFRAAAHKLAVRGFFTPVIGNEVTTSVGHFNIFPVPADGQVPDFKLKDWKSIFESIRPTGARVIILNHPRDLHSGFRPFGPENHLALTGQRLDGRELFASAMEVVNSGAQQTDVMRLVHDWLGLLNRGKFLAPIGSSDSHDVSRYIVGQGRTYIACPDDRPGEIDVPRALANLLAGRVSVSCGLLPQLAINDKYGPGDLAPATDDIQVEVRVLGPSWVKADRVELYANGRKVREAPIGPKDVGPGVKWAGTWTLKRFGHDVHLVAVATGPGVEELYWPIAKPYQATSPKVARRNLGVTGAVWIDADGDGRRTCAYEYAERLVKKANGDVSALMGRLKEYDEAVAAQAFGLLRARDPSILEPATRDLVTAAGGHVARAYEAFAQAWRESEIARAKK